MAGRTRQLPRKLPKQERARATVEAILAATAHILVHQGFAAASTNRIAEKAGVSIGSLYQYFPSKDAAVATLLERHVADMLAVLQEGLAASLTRPVRERTREMVRVMVEAHAVEPALHRVFMEEMPRASQLERVRDIERTFERVAKEHLERDRANVRPRDLDIAAFVIVQAAEAVTHAAVLHRPEMLRRAEFLDETTELIVRYLAADRPRRRGAK
jgi:AcrR family transcriptional regulator